LRVAILASPFISVPPARYGGTELFIASLAESLTAKGVEVVVYSNGESKVNAEVRWRYAKSDWPLANPMAGMAKELDHFSWALQDAAEDCDIIHLNSAVAIAYTRFISRSMLCTLHHPYEEALHELYVRYPNLQYVAISHNQASLYTDLNLHTIHHGIDLSQYRLRAKKDGYLCFLGRIAPLKGVHIAIQAAKQTGIPLKIAGEVQPVFQDYYDTEVKPYIDGTFIEYIGEADLAMKNELLGGSVGMLFPIDWEEPFGLVMLEAMACGTPVFAFGRGAVPEVICEGVSGNICTSLEDMVSCICAMKFDSGSVRRWVEHNFSAEVMTSHYLSLYKRIIEENTEIGATVTSGGEVVA